MLVKLVQASLIKTASFFTIHSHTEKHTSVHYTHTSHFTFQTLTCVLMQINIFLLQVIHNDYYTHYSINYTSQLQLDPHGNILHEFPY